MWQEYLLLIGTTKNGKRKNDMFRNLVALIGTIWILSFPVGIFVLGLCGFAVGIGNLSP